MGELVELVGAFYEWLWDGLKHLLRRDQNRQSAAKPAGQPPVPKRPTSP